MGWYVSKLLQQGTNPRGGRPSHLNNAGPALSQSSDQGGGPSHLNNAGLALSQTLDQGGGQVQTSRNIKPEVKLRGGLHVSDGGEQPSDPLSKSPSENTTEGYKDYDNESYRGLVLCRCCATLVLRERPSIQPCGCITVCRECACRKYAGDKICPACGTKMSSQPKMVGRFQS